MAKNILKKTILILLTIIVGFLINNKEVKAAKTCYWVTYQAYIDSNGNPVNAVGSNAEKYDYKYFKIDSNSSGNSMTVYNSNSKQEMFFYSDDVYEVIKQTKKCSSYVTLYNRGKGYGDELNIVSKSDYEYFTTHMYDGIQKGDNVNIQWADLIGNYTRGLVFISTDIDFGQGETIDGKHYKEINKFYEENNSNKTINDTLLANVEIAFRGARYLFYQNTKDLWFSNVDGIIDDLQKEECDWGYGTSCGSAKIKSLSKGFSKWFNIVGDFLLEERYEKFGNYFKFAKMYDDDYIFDDLATDTMSGKEVLEEMFGVIENRAEHETVEDNKTNYQNDPCLIHCEMCDQSSEDYDSNGCISCQAQLKYKDCKKCYSSCESYNYYTAIESCQNGCMTTEEKQKYDAKIAEFDQKMKELDDALTDTIRRTTAPSLDGVTFNADGYKVNCEDIDFLHTYYMIIIILAPILVVLFGSIDFAKAVIASDEKKMQEFKSKFPKRLGLLVVLIIVPLIIRLILGVTDLDMDLMECVINGYN